MGSIAMPAAVKSHNLASGLTDDRLYLSRIKECQRHYKVSFENARQAELR